jgi:hypothetical protein
MENAVQDKPMNIEINSDLTYQRAILRLMIEALTAPDAPKSRERSLVVTKLEEAHMWANAALCKE